MTWRQMLRKSLSFTRHRALKRRSTHMTRRLFIRLVLTTMAFATTGWAKGKISGQNDDDFIVVDGWVLKSRDFHDL